MLCFRVIRDTISPGVSRLRVYHYSLAVWRFKPILRASLRFHSHLSVGLRLRNYRAFAGNHKFSLRFWVFPCVCGGYSNRRLTGNFIVLKSGSPEISLGGVQNEKIQNPPTLPESRSG